jgi:phosphate-selective porin OprO and OprP
MPINRLTSAAIIAATSFSAVAMGEAWAQSAASAETEIASLKRQLLLMEQKLDALKEQTAANTKAAAKANAKADAKVDVTSANAAIPVKRAIAPSDAVVTMPDNRPTICTADNLNCISITGRLHFDAGGYDYHPNTAATAQQRLDDGVNLRRARIGVIGKIMGDWDYALIYDFGGASDGFASTASVGGAAVGFLPGGALAGVENAYLSYTGFRPFGGKLAIEGGYMDLRGPW